MVVAETHGEHVAPVDAEREVDDDGRAVDDDERRVGGHRRRAHRARPRLRLALGRREERLCWMVVAFFRGGGGKFRDIDDKFD